MSEADAFIERIVAEPDDDGHWLVYADWLIEQGDLRGEAISFALAMHGEAPDRALAEMLTPRLMAVSGAWSLDLWRTFIRSASGGDEDEEASAALFAEPHIGLLRELRLSGYGAKLFDAPRRHLRSLTIADIAPYAERLDTMLPVLEDLRLIPLEDRDWPIVHRNLRHIAADFITGRGLTNGNFDLPRLERLSWEVDLDLMTADPRSIAHVPPRSLKRVRLSGMSDAAQLAALSATPLFEQLVGLDLGNLTSEGVELVIALAPSLRHLKELGIRFLEASSADQQARLRTAFSRTHCVFT